MLENNIASEVLKRHKLVSDYENDIRIAALEDQHFLYKSMWDEQVKQDRQGNGNRPCLEFDKITKYIKKLSNQIRINNPGPRILPEDDKADIKTAQKLRGLIKIILKNANADMKFSSAFENEVENGYGYVRVLTKFESDQSFNQIIDLEYIDNPHSVFIDVDSKEIDCSDSEYGIIITDVDREEFKANYPKAIANDFNSDALGNTNWISENKIRVAEYYRLEKKPDILINGLDKDGNEVIGLESEIREEYGDDYDRIIITRNRPSFKRKWMWYKVTATDVLDKKELAGPDFPIIGFLGRRKNVDNKKILLSYHRKSHDAQRMYNFWRSSEAEQLSMSQKTPYIGAKGQFKSDPGWKHANNTPKPYLEYDPITIGGQLAPKPEKAPAPEPPIGYIGAAQSSNQDIREILGADEGIANSTVGENSSSVQTQILSGKALELINQNGEISNFDFLDNANKSIRRCYRVIINLIPKIYDTERIARILNDDDEEELVVFNGSEGQNEDGEIYDLTVGKYDVDIDVGPDYATRREQTASQMMDFVSKVPGAAEISGDLIAKSQNWKDSDKFAERFKRYIAQNFPSVIELDENDEETLQVQLSQLSAENQQLTDQLDQALQLIQSKQFEKEMIQIKEQGAMNREVLKAQNKIQEQIIDSEGQIKEEKIRSQADIIQTLLQKVDGLTGEIGQLTRIVLERDSQPPLSGELPVQNLERNP